MMQAGTEAQLRKHFEATEEQSQIAVRDCDLIYRIGTASTRRVDIRLVFRDWQSKMRRESHFEERPRKKPANGSQDWSLIYQLWESKILSLPSLLDRFPYLSILPASKRFYDPSDDYRFQQFDWLLRQRASSEHEDDDYFDDGDVPTISLGNRRVAFGIDRFGEANEYYLAIKPNNLGLQMLAWVQDMTQAGFLSVDRDKPKWVSIAPWHHRCV
jgi:hypothetical protein